MTILANQARKTVIKQTAVQSIGVSSYKPEEPDKKVWRNSGLDVQKSKHMQLPD
jgi:hypothetical protein